MNTIPVLEDALSKGCYTMRLEYEPDWECQVLLVSDIHFDAVGCNRELIRSHLEQAKAKNAPVFLLGDTLDLCQGKKDRRAARHALRPEYAGQDDYLMTVCEDAANFLAPYVENIKLISMGNHEWGFLNHQEISPLSVLTTLLHNKTGTAPKVGPYTGWVQFKLEHKTGGRRQSLSLKYHHGTGAGNAPVTKGMIQSNRSVVMWPGADIICRGHLHNRFQASMPVELISNRGRLITDRERLYLQLGCYVNDVKDGDSWSSRMGFGSPAMGGFWLRIYVNKMAVRTVEGIKVQAITTD